RMRARLARELQGVADLAQEGELEAAQDRLQRPLPAGDIAKPAYCLVVRLEQSLVRIVAGRELEQELVEVETRKERLPAQRRRRRRRLRGLQRAQLAAAEPVDLERLEGDEDAAARRLRPSRALRHQPHAPVLLRPGLEDQAGFPIGVGMQDVSAVHE